MEMILGTYLRGNQRRYHGYLDRPSLLLAVLSALATAQKLQLPTALGL